MPLALVEVSKGDHSRPSSSVWGKTVENTNVRWLRHAALWWQAAVWTAVVGASLAWNIRNERVQVLDQAYAEARANYNKDITFRRWGTSHGGVYVPVTETQKSVPWLAHVPGRDVTTLDGRQLTLLNPASMVRQMMDRYAKDYGIRGRITGLRQLNPSNAPDDWEKRQLEAFAHGDRHETWQVADIDGKPFLRYLRAMYMEPGCDKCHGILGYKTGELRGATGVNLPLEGYYAVIDKAIFDLSLTHGGIWLLGLAGIGWFGRDHVRRMLERQRLVDALHDEKEHLQVTLASIGDAVLTTDADGRITFMNGVAEALTGWSLKQASGQLVEKVVVLINEETREPVPSPVERCRKEGVVVGLANHTILVSRNGDELAIDDSAAPIRDAQGALIGVVMVFHDVSAAREMSRKISWQATHDSLTGLISRNEFECRLRRLAETQVERGVSHALLYLDLDNFKIVNDTCGHLAGDEMLKQVTFLLAEHMRKNDTLARLGGDEFGVLLENCPLGKAKEIAEKLLVTIAEHRFAWGGKTFDMGMSIGLTTVVPGEVTAAEALSAADVACYAAKEDGRNRVHAYDADNADSLSRHRELHIASDIRAAIEAGRFVLYAQPILATNGKGERRFEILVRMLDTNGELVPPGAFIPAAERFGLMPSVDRWVVAKVLSELRTLGEDGDGIGVSINLSGLCFRDTDFAAWLSERISESGVSPARLTFEVTETAAIMHLTMGVRFMRELRAIGCRFALDDFGSGMSSFAYLKALPVDELKIDGAFVRDVLDDPADRAFVEAIHKVAATLGMETVAEFTETLDIAQALREIGVDYVQGYAIGRPARLEEALTATRSPS